MSPLWALDQAEEIVWFPPISFRLDVPIPVGACCSDHEHAVDTFADEVLPLATVDFCHGLLLRLAPPRAASIQAAYAQDAFVRVEAVILVDAPDGLGLWHVQGPYNGTRRTLIYQNKARTQSRSASYPQPENDAPTRTGSSDLGASLTPDGAAFHCWSASFPRLQSITVRTRKFSSDLAS